jgi:hypothetical protein
LVWILRTGMGGSFPGEHDSILIRSLSKDEAPA